MSRRCVAQGVCFDRSPITSIFTVFGIFFLRFPILLHSLAWRRLFFSFIAYRLSLTDVCTHVFKAFTTLSISRSSDVFNVQNYRSLYRNLSPKSTLPFQWHYVSRFVFTATHSKDKVTAPFVATDDKSTLAKYCPPPPPFELYKEIVVGLVKFPNWENAIECLWKTCMPSFFLSRRQ